jgi:ferric-dicitrate binding protein FerR (iron transport regulator)
MNNKLRFLVRQAIASSPATPRDTDGGWEQVKRKHTRQQVRRLLLRVTRYAAVIALVVGIWYILSPVPVEVPPTSTTRATLVLANGERVEWGDASQQARVEELGVSVTRDGARGIMHYHADSLAGEETRENHLFVPRGSEFIARLPDGSTVWLNSASTLHFPVRFSRDERVVRLEGEGYFEIAADASRPFRVLSGDREIIVTGTSFNVSAYADDPTWHVTLVEGSLRVRAGGREVRLTPATRFLLHESTGMGELLDDVETDTYTAWTRGQIYFRLSPLEEIVRKLERWYDFTITYETEELKHVQFRGGINKYRPLEETLRYLEETGKIRFLLDGRHVTATKIHP